MSKLYLEPCALCGSDYREQRYKSGKGFRRKCGNCGMQTAWFPTTEESLAAWNRRPVIAQPVKDHDFSHISIGTVVAFDDAQKSGTFIVVDKVESYEWPNIHKCVGHLIKLDGAHGFMSDHVWDKLGGYIVCQPDPAPPPAPPPTIGQPS